MENLTDLKIIAQFMGMEFIQSMSPYTITHSNWLSDKDLVSTYKFDREWNWIMPVVEKIEDIKTNNLCLYDVNIYGNKCLIERQHVPPIDVIEETKIDAVFMACLLFIDWYTREISEEAIELFMYDHLIPDDVKEVLDQMALELEHDGDYPVLAEYLEKVNEVGFRFEYGLDGTPFNLCNSDYYDELKGMFEDGILINPEDEPIDSSPESKADAAIMQGYFKYKTGEIHKITLNDLLGK